MTLLRVLEGDGRHVHGIGGTLRIEPVTGLGAGDRRVLEDLKPELLAWLSFTPHQRSILFPFDPDLQQLRRYREGLEYWLRFTPDEQSRMIGLPWTPEDLRAVADLRKECDGEVFECEGPPGNKEGQRMAG